MKQLLLAAALIALPVAAFTGFSVYQARAGVSANAPAASLGDLSAFSAIIIDVKSLADRGDLVAAKARIKDFEIAWDQSEPGLKPMNPAHWGEIDDAADAALSALRAKKPDAATVNETLVLLLATLQSHPAVSQ
ncbi:MAG: putative signal peptide protein [Tardiphaga sp.]|nr:putative signal peptide protein [Tardiphaga sp.]